MLTALQELSGKSLDLYDALKVQFAKNERLAAGKTFRVHGLVTIKPKVEEEPPIVIPDLCPKEVKIPTIDVGIDSDAKSGVKAEQEKVLKAVAEMLKAAPVAPKA